YISGQDVVGVVLFRMKWTLLLAVSAIVISAVVGGALGVLAGYHKGGRLDSVLTFVFLLLETIPANCLALIVLVIFAFNLKWFPVGGMASGGLTGLAKFGDTLYHMVLPVSVLALFRTSGNFLMMKSFVSQIREEEYILTAEAKGLPRRKVLFSHVLRNVMVPYVTMLCMQFGTILSGAMIIEIVFSWKGMGTLIYDGVMQHDYPTVQLCFLMISVCVIFFHFLADILAWRLDPRLKEGAAIYED
ncbi:MAG: ABC transporter permease, partial [Eubacterium sp.]